jgi:hypothetical protein
LIESPPLSIYLDVSSFTLVFVSCSVVAIASQMSGSTKGFVVLRDIGVPVALIGALAGAFGMALNLSDPSLIYQSTSLLLVTALYGGIVSGLGIFIGGQEPSIDSKPDSPIPIYLATGVTFFMCFWGMKISAGLELFFAPVLLSIYGIVVVLAFVRRKKSVLGVLADAALFGSLLCVIIGLIARFSDYVQAGLQISMGGLVLGLLTYLFSVCISYGVGSQGEIDAQRQNWHWLELTGFLLFMYFAPETLREVLLALDA